MSLLMRNLERKSGFETPDASIDHETPHSADFPLENRPMARQFPQLDISRESLMPHLRQLTSLLHAWRPLGCSDDAKSPGAHAVDAANAIAPDLGLIVGTREG